MAYNPTAQIVPETYIGGAYPTPPVDAVWADTSAPVTDGPGLILADYVEKSRRINNGVGLLGGGDLYADKTLDVDTNTIATKSYTDTQNNLRVPKAKYTNNLIRSTVVAMTDGVESIIPWESSNPEAGVTAFPWSVDGVLINIPGLYWVKFRASTSTPGITGSNFELALKKKPDDTGGWVEEINMESTISASNVGIDIAHMIWVNTTMRVSAGVTYWAPGTAPGPINCNYGRLTVWGPL